MTTRRTRIDTLVLALILAASGVIVWHELFRGWFEVDDGGMAQVAARVLAGQLPHRDFDDPWTGGWSYLQAGVFRAFGSSLAALRVPIFIAWLGALAAAFHIARRFSGTLVAALVTIACATWSLYAWHFPILNWYYLPLALASAFGVMRFTESGLRRWLVIAGLSAGVAIDLKVSGFFLLAALLLWALSLPSREGEPRAGDRDGLGFGIFAYILAAAWTFMVLALIWRLPLHEAPLLHFVVPSAVVALWAAREGDMAGYELVPGTVALLRIVLPIAAGVLIGVAPLVIWFAAQGALHDLWIGVFVKSAVRMTVTFLPPPGRLATVALATAPAILLFGSRRAHVSRRGVTLMTAVALGIAVGLCVHLGDDAVDLTNMAIRSVPIVLPIIGLAWSARFRDDPARGNLALLLVALAATGQLIQVPYARLAYFLYTAPLVILAFAAVLARRRESAEGTTIFAMVFLVAAGAGHPSWNAMLYPPERWAALPSSRGGIFVPAEDSIRWANIERVMSTLPPGPVHAVFESPQYNFLLDRPNPRRIIYDVLADSASHDAGTTMRQLDSAGVMLAILSSPIEGDIRPPWSVMRPHFGAVRRAFPHETKIGSVEIRWRDRIEPVPAPAVVPRDTKR